MIRKRERDAVERIIAELGERGLLPFPITEAVAREACAEGELRPGPTEEQIRTVLRRARAERVLKELGLPPFRVVETLRPERVPGYCARDGAALVPLVAARATGEDESPFDQPGAYLLVEPAPGCNALAIQLAEGMAPDPLQAGDLVLVCAGPPDPGIRSPLLLVDDGGGLRVRRSNRPGGRTGRVQTLGRVAGWADRAGIALPG